MATAHLSNQPSLRTLRRSIFARAYSFRSKVLHTSFMDAPAPATCSPPVTDLFYPEEVEAVIAKAKTNSSPSPLDQIPYTVLKKCPSLMPALLHLYNACWSHSGCPAGMEGRRHSAAREVQSRTRPEPTSTLPPHCTDLLHWKGVQQPAKTALVGLHAGQQLHGHFCAEGIH